MTNGTVGKPDPLALEIARVAQEWAKPAVVMLFGSRARGDYRNDSDIDLLVITDDAEPKKAMLAASAGVRSHRKQTGIVIPDDIIGMTRKRFNRCRLAKQHIAGQADTYGIAMSGERPEYSNEWDDGYPDHWPETQRRIKSTERWLKNYSERVESGHWDQEGMGFEAQQTVEHALKGWLSCLNQNASYTHNLRDLWNELDKLGELDKEETRKIQEAGQRLFDYIEYSDPSYPEEIKDWLTNYAVIYRYDGTEHQITPGERVNLHDAINDLVEAVLEHIHHLSGTDATDVYPQGLRPWETHRTNP